jgi:ABC-2 type transport system permease protein
VPFLLVMLAGFALGCAMLLSSLFVRYRDIEPIWDVVLQALFYATPILYTLQTVQEKSSEKVVQLMMFNPIGAIIEQARHALVSPSYLSVSAALQNRALLIIPLGIMALTVLAGFWYFSREAPRVAEDL